MSVQIHPKYIKRNDHCDLWDLGPKRPMPPEAPVEPDKAKLKGHDLALAQIQYEDAFDTYKTDLRAYGRLKDEHKAWHDKNGGPLKVDFWSTDAVVALTVDPERYFLELPRGMKPGKAQIEAEDRLARADQELQEARENDPQFGKGTKR